MADMGDISSLLGEQAPVDETTLPDSGTTDADLEGGGQETLTPTDEHGEQQPARQRVPLGALQEERARRQELQDQNKQLMEQQAKMQERFQQMMERMAQPQQPQQPQEAPIEIPAFIDDPEGHINGLRQQLTRELEQVKQFQQQAMQQQQHGAQNQQLAQYVSAAEQEFTAKTPDYKVAADYFEQRKTAEYAALGLDPVTIRNQIQRDYQGLAMAAAQRGANPAEMLYNLAKAIGYTAGAQQQAQQGTQQPKAAPTSLGSLPAVPKAPDEQGGVSLESVANMTDSEFDKFWKQMERGSRAAPKF